MGIFGTITGFKAIGAKKLRVEFGSAVAKASQATLSIKKGKSDVKGTPIWTDGDKAVTYVTEGFLQQGKYTASINGGEGKEIDVQAEEVKEIVIKNKDNILTGTSSSSKQEGRSNDEAYIYYDVKNQYDESIRERTTINWSITSCDAERDNKNLGLVVAHRKNDREIFTYGAKLDVTAVCIKDGQTKTGHEVVTIGQIQAINEVKSKGFVKRAAKGRKLDWEKDKRDLSKDVVPADFPKNTWALMYEAYDQNGDILEPAKDNLSSATEGAKLTFVSGTPTCIMNDFSDGEVYTIMEKQDDGTTVEKEYSSVTIEPGAYIDRESKIKLSAISTRTGHSIDEEFDIGPTPVLKSFKMETPSFVVADGDRDVDIPFTAEDMDGNDVTSYKTIARSSNTLNLTASEGTLTLSEGRNGEAVLRWSDDHKYWEDIDGDGIFNPYDMYKNNGIMINDNIDRTISLTAVVTGKTENANNSNTTRLSVSDMRRPASIEDVRFGPDGNDMVIAGTNPAVDIAYDIIYTDQYGKELNGLVYGTWNRQSSFWEAARDGNIRGYNYSIRVNQLSGSHPVFGETHNTGSTNSNTTGSASDTAQDAIINNYGGIAGGTDSSTAVNADVINLEKNSKDSLNKTVIPYINHNTKFSIFDKVIETDKSGQKLYYQTNGTKGTTQTNNPCYKWVGVEEVRKVADATVKYSLVESEKTGNSRYNDIGKARTETYTIVPIEDVSDFSIETHMPKDKLGIITALSGKPNGSFNVTGSYNYGNIDPNKPIFNYNNSPTYNKGDKGYKESDVQKDTYITTNQAVSIATTNKKKVDDYFNINEIRVKAKYKNTVLTVPNKYVSSTEAGPWDKTGNAVSGSSLYVKSVKDPYTISIDSINYKSGTYVTWSDLYDVNTARYTRKPNPDAKLELFVDRYNRSYYFKKGVGVTSDNDRYYDWNSYKSEVLKSTVADESQLVTWKNTYKDYTELYDLPNGKKGFYVPSLVKSSATINKGAVISTRIKISDELSEPYEIELSDGYMSPSMTNVENTEPNIERAAGLNVLDQYGQKNNERKVLFTVTDYNENLDGRLDDNHAITNNGYDNSKITGAERGDSYTLTASLSNTGIAKSAKMIVDADIAARIVSNKSMTESTEYDLRYNHLGYNR